MENKYHLERRIFDKKKKTLLILLEKIAVGHSFIYFLFIFFFLKCFRNPCKPNVKRTKDNTQDNTRVFKYR